MRLVILLLSLGSWTLPAFAQETVAPTEVFDAGVRAMERQDWVAAELLFRQAYEVEPSERVRFNLAESLFQQDRMIAARVEAEAVRDGSDLLLKDAAVTLLARIDAALASIRVRTNELPRGVDVLLDGEEIATDVALETNPGEHTVALHDGDRALTERRVTLARGAERVVVLELDLSPGAVAAEADVDGERDLLGGPVARTRRRRRIAIGVSAAIVVVASVVLGVGLSRRDGGPSGDTMPIVFGGP